jgi:tRNA (uracil-5-)-methyltransferase
MSVGQVYPDQYQSLFTEKCLRVIDQFADLAVPEPECHPSPAEYYRMRAEFRVWHEGDDSFYIMFNPEDREKVRIDHFPVGNRLINDLMQTLRAAFLNDPVLRFKLYQVEFLTTTKGQALVTLIYHRKLDDEWLARALELEKELDIHLIGRSRKQRIVVSQEYVEEQFQVGDSSYQYRQYENGFTQPNATLCETMLNWAVKHSQNISGDLLELYCGNGNFTLPLARNFNKVLATEISKTSIRSAKENAESNQSDNVSFEKTSSEDFSKAWLGGDEKLNQRMNLDQYKFSTVFVDPPRAGLDNDSVELVRNFDNIIYISCNPNTLHQNAAALSDTHNITQFALFDQFPYTHHMECGMVLVKR